MKSIDLDKVINKLDETAVIAKPLDLREAERIIRASQTKKEKEKVGKEKKSPQRTGRRRAASRS